MRNSQGLLVRLAATWLAASLMVSPLAVAQNPPDAGVQPIREIFVPYEALDVLLENKTRHVFLTREQYKDLLLKAKAAPEDRTPLGATVLSARYEAAVETTRLRLTGQIEVEVMRDGLQAIPLGLANVGLRRAILDGQPAPIGHNEQGLAMLFVEGKGTRLLTLEMVAPLTTSAAQQSASFQVPTPPATRFHLAVPGNVEMKTGTQVISREVDATTGVTRFELLPTGTQTELAMSLNNRMLQHQSVVVARSVLVDEITSAYERLHATVSLGLLHGAIDQFRFAIPPGFEVTDVTTPLLARFAIETVDERQILNVVLREPTTETVVLNISAVKTPSPLETWTVPRLVPLETAGQVAVVGLLLESRMKVSGIRTNGLIPIDNAVLTAAIPSSVFEVDPGAPQIRSVAAYYAPQSEYSLSADFARPAAQVDAVTNLLLTLAEKEQTVLGRFTLRPETDKLFEVAFSVPAGWHVSDVSWGENEVLPFETFAAAAADGRSRVRVRLPRGIAPGDSAQLLFHAVSVPAGWLGQWTESELAFPVFTVEGAAHESGAIAIRAIDDFSVRPDKLQQLTPMDDDEKEKHGLKDVVADLAYRFQAQPVAATLKIQRTAPRITARTYSFLRAEPEGLSAHYELIYEVAAARTRELSLRLPVSTPSTISIRGLDSAVVKEFSSTIVDGEWRWTAALADARSGVIRLAVDFQDRLQEQEPKDLVLPVVKADGVVYQTAFVAVEGHGELDVQVETNGRKVDVGQLAGADYRVGRRLLGSFGFLGPAGEVKIDIDRRPGYRLPAAIVERAELVTLISTGGLAQTGARYHLRTKAPYLELQLPPSSTLWSILLDGKSSKPQREGESLLISLPGTSGVLNDLQIVYETPVGAIGPMGTIEAPAPTLFLRTEDGKTDREVPVGNLEWHLALPAGYRVVAEAGTVFTSHLGPRPLPITRAASLLASVPIPVPRVQAGLSEFKSTDMSREFRGGVTARLAEDTVANSADAPLASTAPPSSPPGSQNGAPFEASRDQLSVAPGVHHGVAAQPPMAGPSPPEGEKRPAANVAPQGNSDLWALEGVGSLQIEVEEQQMTGDRVTFRSLGTNPRLVATLIEGRRMEFATWFAAFAVTLVGWMLTSRTWRVKIRYLLFVWVMASAVPLVSGWIHELGDICDGAFLAGCLLVPYYLLAAAVARIWRSASPTAWRLATGTAGTAAMLLALAPVGWGQEIQSVSTDDLAPVHEKMEPVSLPDDAVIIPYDADLGAEGIKTAEKLLVPYDKYMELWNRAFPDKKIQATSTTAQYALAGAEYSARLEGEDHLLVHGQLMIEVFTDESVTVPLPLSGGVLARALLDGKPARLRVAQPVEPGPQATPQVAASGPVAANLPGQDPPAALIALQTEGRGRKKLELTLRVRLERTGGWRIAEAHVPAAVATALALQVPDARTEVRVAGVDDRQTYETLAADESIETALARSGQLSLRWRPKVAEAQVDQSLTARSTAVLDVQEDGLRISWRVDLQFRRSRRDSFSVDVPADYLVERVVGGNVRSWEVGGDAPRQRVTITLLKDVTDQESFTIVLSRRVAVGHDQMASFMVPHIQVTDAALHTGVLQIRRSPQLELRAVTQTGVSRTDAPEQQAATVIEAAGYEESPLGIRPFQAYSFAALPFTLQLSATPVTPRSSADLQSVLRIAEDAVELESRITFDIQDRPVHVARLTVPAELQVTEVIAPGAYEWALTGTGPRRELAVYLAAGQQGPFALLVRGKLSRTGDVADVILPRLEVQDVNRQQGAFAVQIDPAYSATAAELVSCEVALRERVYPWLTEQQRSVTQLAIQYRSPDYSGRIRVTPEKPEIRALTVTNVKVTEHTIEETILFNFDVSRAGARQLSFLLPERLQRATIQVPLLRQKTITPVNSPPDYVRVDLELQDNVMGQIRVLLKHDRLLSADEQTAPIPVVETGETTGRFVVLENAGRDEVLDTPSELEPLSRLQSQRQILAEILGTGLTQAYMVRRDAAAPTLAFRTKQRVAVETASARIGKAETVLVLDGSGTYRAQVELRINNDSEQFLEIRLPADSQLWTASVANEPVKPTLVPGVSDPQQIRIPLVKTAEGDPDYPVVLQYAGQLRLVGNWDTADFPLIRTVNINVELSQVRLRLPRTHRWFNFNGTMTQTRDEGSYRAGDIAHLTEQMRTLTQVLSSKNPYSRIRAKHNLQQLEEAQGEVLRSYFGKFSSSSEVQAQLEENRAVAQQAQQLQQQSEVEPQQPDGNSTQLEGFFNQQRNDRSRNIVSKLGSNFDAPEQSAQTSAGEESAAFNNKWLMQNKLQNAPAANPDSDMRFGQGQGGKEPRDSKTEQLFDDYDRAKLAAQEAAAPTAAKPAADTERYRQQLGSQQRPASALAKRKRAPIAAGGSMSGQPGGSGMMSGPGGVASGMGGMSGPGGMAGGGAGGMGGGMPANAIPRMGKADGSYLDGTDKASAYSEFQVDTWNGSEVAEGDKSAPGSDPAVSSGYLSSLNVELPLSADGTDYFFTSPRGEIRITATLIPATLFDRVFKLLLIAGFVIGLLVATRLARSFVRAAHGMAT